MPRRYLVYQPTFHEFIGDFSPCPLADRPSRSLRRFAGQSLYLADLFISDPSRLARPRLIAQTIFHRQVLQGC